MPNSLISISTNPSYYGSSTLIERLRREEYECSIFFIANRMNRNKEDFLTHRSFRLSIMENILSRIETEKDKNEGEEIFNRTIEGWRELKAFHIQTSKLSLKVLINEYRKIENNLNSRNILEMSERRDMLDRICKIEVDNISDPQILELASICREYSKSIYSNFECYI